MDACRLARCLLLLEAILSATGQPDISGIAVEASWNIDCSLDPTSCTTAGHPSLLQVARSSSGKSVEDTSRPHKSAKRKQAAKQAVEKATKDADLEDLVEEIFVEQSIKVKGTLGKAKETPSSVMRSGGSNSLGVVVSSDEFSEQGRIAGNKGLDEKVMKAEAAVVPWTSSDTSNASSIDVSSKDFLEAKLVDGTTSSVRESSSDSSSSAVSSEDALEQNRTRVNNALDNKITKAQEALMAEDGPGDSQGLAKHSASHAASNMGSSAQKVGESKVASTREAGFASSSNAASREDIVNQKRVKVNGILDQKVLKAKESFRRQSSSEGSKSLPSHNTRNQTSRRSSQQLKPRPRYSALKRALAKKTIVPALDEKVSRNSSQELEPSEDEKCGEMLCRWSCSNPTCEEECKPQCQAPKCETRCATMELLGCEVECEKPECVNVCRKNQCPHSNCPGCTTQCSNPLCKMKCPQTQNCTNVCETPACQWHCKKPQDCPKPECKLQCDQPSEGCAKSVHVSLPALKKGELRIESFMPPVEMNLLQVLPGQLTPAGNFGRMNEAVTLPVRVESLNSETAQLSHVFMDVPLASRDVTGR